MEHKKGFWKGFIIGGICFFVLGALGVLGMTRLLQALSEKSREHYSTEATVPTSALPESDPASSGRPSRPSSEAQQNSTEAASTPDSSQAARIIDRNEDSFLNMLAAMTDLIEENQVLEYDLEEMQLAAGQAYVEAFGEDWERYKNAKPEHLGVAQVIEREDYDFLNRLGEIKELVQERRIISSRFVEPGTQEAAEIAAYRAFVAATGDAYSEFMTAEEWEASQESSSGVYYGIGVQIIQDNETMTCTVTAVFSNSPAKEAGILVGDIFRSVDGVDVTQMPISELVTYVRGEAGTKVHLTIFRPALNQEIELDCERRKVEVDTVQSRMLTDDIGLIHLTEFDEISLSQMKKALDDLSSKGMKKLVLDLRGNPGGLLNTVLEIADLFLDGGQMIFKMDYKDGEVYTERTRTRASFKGDMVVLVNGGSASASEVLTGIMQDYERAVVMGEKTYGKGIVQSYFELPEDNVLKLTIAHYYSPTGRDFHGVGIEPDIAMADDVLTEEDELLNLAIEQLQK